MAITHTWNVVQMDCYPQADGETDVAFTVSCPRLLARGRLS